MADYKDYIVRYNITVNAGEAITTMDKLVASIEKSKGGAEQLAQSFTKIAAGARSMESNANFKFEPTINMAGFEAQLNSMVQKVNEAAGKMQAALYRGLTAQGNGKDIVKEAGGQSLQRDITTIAAERDKLTRSLSAILGKEDARSAKIGTSKSLGKIIDKISNGDKEVAKQIRAIKYAPGGLSELDNAIQQNNTAEIEKVMSRMHREQTLLTNIGKEYAEVEKFQNQLLAKMEKAGKVPPGTSAAKPGENLLTNSNINALQQAIKTLNGKKDIAIKITGNANRALETIKEVNTKLTELESKGSFTINPILGEGFAKAKEELAGLARLSSLVQAPLTYRPETGVSQDQNAATQLVKDSDKIAKEEKRLANLNKRRTDAQKALVKTAADYKASQTPELKEQLEKDQAALNKIDEKIKKSQTKIAQFKQGAATAPAPTVSQSAPQHIDVIGNLLELKAKVTPELPVNVKIMADQVAAQVKAIPKQEIPLYVKVVTEGIPQQLQNLMGQQKADEQKKTAAQQKSAYTPPAFTQKDQLRAQELNRQYWGENGLGLQKIALQEKLNKQLYEIESRKSQGAPIKRAQMLYDSTKAKYNKLLQTVAPIEREMRQLAKKQFQSTASYELSEADKWLGAQHSEELAKNMALKNPTQKDLNRRAFLQKEIDRLRKPQTVPSASASGTSSSAHTIPILIEPVLGNFAEQIKAAVPKSLSTKVTLNVAKSAKLEELTKGMAPVEIPISTAKAVGVFQHFLKYIKTLANEPISLNLVAPQTQPLKEKVKADKRVAAPKQTVTAQVKLNLTGAKEQLKNFSGSVKVSVKGDLSALKNLLKGFAPPTITVPVTAKWAKDVLNTKGQFKNLVGKVPESSLVLNTEGAKTALKEFISKIPKSKTIQIGISQKGKKGTVADSLTTLNNKIAEIAKTIKPIPVKLNTAPAMEQLNTFIAEVQSKGITLNVTANVAGAAGAAAGGGTNQNANAGAGTTSNQTNVAGGTGSKGTSKSPKSKKTVLDEIKEKQAKNQLTPLQKKYNRLANAFAQVTGANDSQVKWMVENRKSLANAAKAAGFVQPGEKGFFSYEELVPIQKAEFINALQHTLHEEGKKIPAWLRKEGLKQTAKARWEEELENGSGGGGGRKWRGKIKEFNTAYQRPLFDRARKWSYPFTGVTSFGQRTPMAVDMAKGMGVMFAIGGAMSAIGSSFSQAMEYQNIMRTTKAILQNGTDSYTESGFKNMEQTVRNVGIKTKFSAPEVANAARFLAMAGYDIDAINHAIRPIADLALIGDTDLGETADKITNIMTTFGIPAEKMREAANIMTTTATRSNTDLMMLAESAKYGGGVAHMYGLNDPNLFADTMAIFGVMGNAGIQASSAGTALRMMYQNIFKPNKNQQKVLDMLDTTYGIKTKDANGGFRSMSDILVEMANKIPQKELASVIGNLFRITAQPGANAAIMAAAEEEGTNPEEVAKGLLAVDDFLEKQGFSKLIDLMLANRQAAGGHISENVSEEKQNTISGLWAQVTSTFTEGIVKAFETKENFFTDILKDLRDYLAKPETVQMLQNLLNLIIDIVKVMSEFVGLWAKFYNLCPGLIKEWVRWQMIFTQFGYLLSPAVSLIGAFSRLGDIMKKLAGIQLLSGISSSTGSLASGGIGAGTALFSRSATAKRIAAKKAEDLGLAEAALTMPFLVGYGRKGKEIAIKGGAAVRANAVARQAREARIEAQQAALTARQGMRIEDALMTSMIVQNGWANDPSAQKWKHNPLFQAAQKRRQNYAVQLAGAESTVASTTKALAENKAHYAEVRARAKRIYGLSWSKIWKTVVAGATAGSDGMMFASMFKNIGTMFRGLILGMAKTLGLLVNPITLAIAGMAALAFFIHKFVQRVRGTSEEQVIALQRISQAAAETTKAYAEATQWYNNSIGWKKPTIGQIDITGKSEGEVLYEQQQSRFKKLNADLLSDPESGASTASNKAIVDNWRNTVQNDNLLRLAMGDKYDEWVGTGLDKGVNNAKYNNIFYDLAISGIFRTAKSLPNRWHQHDKNAKAIKDNMVISRLAAEGAMDPIVETTVKQMQELATQFANGKIKTLDEYQQQAIALRDKVVNLSNPNLLSAEGMTFEQYQQAPNKQMYLPYQEAIYNILTANITGERGTLLGNIIAMKELQSKVNMYTPQWWRNLGNALTGWEVMINAGTDNMAKEVKVILDTMPDGKLNFNSIVAQIQEKVTGFTANLQQFAQISAMVYKMMVEAGIVSGENLNDWQKGIYSQIMHQHIDYATALKYYQDFDLAHNADWGLQGIGAEEYANMVSGSENNFLPNGKSSAWERTIMRKNIAKSAGTTGFNGFAPIINSVNNGATDSVQNTQNHANDLAYANHYSGGAARPTQVVINIDHLAHFDRTAIASSADERDLMAAMEGKLVDVVYRLFAEASNQANQVIDIT